MRGQRERLGQGQRWAGRQFRYGLLIWLACVSIGVGVLTAYANRPGVIESASPDWPKTSQLMRRADRTMARLVVFIHPKCGCSRATLAELERLLPELKGHYQVVVAVYAPDSQSIGWIEGDNWKKAKNMPGVTVLKDRNGIEADRFGARTSGEVFAYDYELHLAFHGGLTPSRGHEGASRGQSAILDLVARRVPAARRALVFGCRLKATSAKESSDRT